MKKLTIIAMTLLTLLATSATQPAFAGEGAKAKSDITPYCWFICPPDAAKTTNEKQQ